MQPPWLDRLAVLDLLRRFVAALLLSLLVWTIGAVWFLIAMHRALVP